MIKLNQRRLSAKSSHCGYIRFNMAVNGSQKPYCIRVGPRYERERRLLTQSGPKADVQGKVYEKFKK